MNGDRAISNATRYYCSREAVKAAVGIVGAKSDAVIDRNIEAASEDIERLLVPLTFIPVTATRTYRWPQVNGRSAVLRIPGWDLIAVTTLQAKAQDSSPTTIAAADYFIEPANEGPPYRRIEIDLSSTAAFEAGDTPQRSISIAGRWGYREDTKAAGALAEGLDTSETEVQITNASLIDVGDTLKIESEAMFVSAKAALTTGTTLNDTLTVDRNDVTVTLASGAAAKVGEVLLLDSERMLVEDITGNDLTVQRAYDGSVLAAHSTGITVYAYRSLTVVRAVNGTTAATHADTTAITKYAPPADIVELCLAQAIAHMTQGESRWTGQISGGEGAVNVRMVDLFHLRRSIIEKYARVTH